MPPQYIVRWSTEDCVDQMAEGLCTLSLDIAELQHQSKRVKGQEKRHKRNRHSACPGQAGDG